MPKSWNCHHAVNDSFPGTRRGIADFPVFISTNFAQNIRPRTNAKSLVHDAYPEDISSNLGPQMQRLKTCFSTQFEKIMSIHELTEFLLINCQASSSFPDVTTACLIYPTLPVTVATAERSFSKRKLIITYLRTSMSQN